VQPYYLYCALKAAWQLVSGKYIHHRAAIHEVRFLSLVGYLENISR